MCKSGSTGRSLLVISEGNNRRSCAAVDTWQAGDSGCSTQQAVPPRASVQGWEC